MCSSRSQDEFLQPYKLGYVGEPIFPRFYFLAQKSLQRGQGPMQTDKIYDLLRQKIVWF